MGILRLFFSRRVKRLDDAPPDIPEVIPEIPDEDSEDFVDFDSLAETHIEEAHNKYEALEPIYVMIEYTDAKGDFSRRRVTIRSLKHQDTGAVFYAYCHERKALRCFRADRIESVITSDGEVHDPNKFWDRIGIDIRAPHTRESHVIAKELRERFRPAITLLVALGKADGRLGSAEAGAIMTYIEREADDLGLRWTPEAMEIIYAVIQRMRPSLEIIDQSSDSIQKLSAQRRKYFLRAVFELVHADGRVSEEEIKFIESLSVWVDDVL